MDEDKWIRDKAAQEDGAMVHAGRFQPIPSQQAALEQADWYCPSGGHKMNAIDPKRVVGLMRWWCPQCNVPYSGGFAIGRQKISLASEDLEA